MQYDIVSPYRLNPPATATAGAGCGVAVAVAGWGILHPWNQSKNRGFRMPWDVIGKQFQGLGLKLKAFGLTLRYSARHLCQKFTGVDR